MTSFWRHKISLTTKNFRVSHDITKLENHISSSLIDFAFQIVLARKLFTVKRRRVFLFVLQRKYFPFSSHQGKRLISCINSWEMGRNQLKWRNYTNKITKRPTVSFRHKRPWRGRRWVWGCGWVGKFANIGAQTEKILTPLKSFRSSLLL